jgi:hypothetical protein
MRSTRKENTNGEVPITAGTIPTRGNGTGHKATGAAKQSNRRQP